MSNIELLDFCDTWLQAWTGNQADKLLSYYHDDIYYVDPGYPQGLRGKKDLKVYLNRLLAKYPHWIWSREEMFITEKGFNLKWKVKLFNGNEIYGMDLVELEVCKIIRNEVYFDRSLLFS